MKLRTGLIAVTALVLSISAAAGAEHGKYWHCHHPDSGPGFYLVTGSKLVTHGGGGATVDVACEPGDYAISDGGQWTVGGVLATWPTQREIVSAIPVLEGDRVSAYDFAIINNNPENDADFTGFVTCAH